MSCRHGNWEPCDLCDEVEAARAEGAAAERERCAKLMDSMWNEYKTAHPSYRSDYEEGYLDALDAAEQRLKGPNHQADKEQP